MAEKKIIESPLINKQEQIASKIEDEKHGKSTINLDKFDMRRFSERKNEEQNPVRTILYIVIVILIGVGLTMLVRQFINRNSTSNDTKETNNTQEEEQVVEEEDLININISPKSDNVSLSSSSKAEFQTAVSTSVGNSTLTTSPSLSKFNYDKYTTYSQASFEFSEITNASQFPQIVLNYDSTANTLKIKFASNIDTKSIFKEQVIVNDVVSNMSYKSETFELTLTLREALRHRMLLLNNLLIVDLKTEAQFTKESQNVAEEETTVETNNDTTQTQTSQNNQSNTNVTTNYNNAFSQTKQSVVSNLTTNSLELEHIFYEDAVNYFEFGLGRIGYVGENYIPNATAELVEEGGINYIYLTVQNVSGVNFTSVTQAGISITLETANFVRADRVSLDNGKLVIKIQLKNKADFRLASDKTIDGSTQVLTLQIKD